MKKYILLSFMLFITLCIKAATPYCVLSGSTLTFYCDDISHSGTKYDLVYVDDYPKWKSKASSIRTVIFDSSFEAARPTNGNYWFYNMTNLTSIQGLSHLNTSEMTSMGYMFYNCKLLPNIDLSHFNTSKVTLMVGMF